MDGQNQNPNNGVPGTGVPAGQPEGGKKEPETKKPWIGARIWNGIKKHKGDILKFEAGAVTGAGLTYLGSEVGNRLAAKKAEKQMQQYQAQVQEQEVSSLDPNVM